jgi:hypothetical protein
LIAAIYFASVLWQPGHGEIEKSEKNILSVFLNLSALEKDCSFVNLPDGSLSDIARLLQTIKY